MTINSEESGDNTFGKIINSIKTNKFLPLIFVILAIVIVAFNLVDTGKWIYREGYGPMSLERVRELGVAVVQFNHDASIFDILGGQALGAGLNGIMLMLTILTAICVLFRLSNLSIIGLILMGAANIFQIYAFLSDMEKISGMYGLFVFLSLCTLGLTILLIAMINKAKWKLFRASAQPVGY